MHDGTLYAAHNEIKFYTWGDARVLPPDGATRRTLLGDLDQRSQPGDVLDLRGAAGTATRASPPTPTRRIAGRAPHRPSSSSDAIGGDSRGSGRTQARRSPRSMGCRGRAAVPALHLVGHGRGTRRQPVDDVSVARGNIVLADHGGTVIETISARETVPAARPRARDPAVGRLRLRRRMSRCQIPPRFRPRLAEVAAHAGSDRPTRPPSCKAVACDSRSIPMRRRLGVRVGHAAGRPAIRLEDSVRRRVAAAARPACRATTRRSTSSSKSSDDGTAPRCASATTCTACVPRLRPSSWRRYRVGNGLAGNIGADAIAHIVTTDDAHRRRAQPAARARRHGSRDARAGAPERAVRVPHAAARRHAGRLRRGHRAASGRAACRGDRALDRQLAHGLPHRRSSRRLPVDDRLPTDDHATMSSSTAWPATTSKSTAGARVARGRDARCASSRTISAADVERALLDVFSARRCRDGGAGSSIRTTSLSASRCI